MRRRAKKPTTDEDAALIIQKSFRGFRCRKSFSVYKQRLDVQTLCFLQQIELINQDFYTKIVRTNYCVPMKSIESPPAAKVFSKSISSLFPPPPPLPLPSPSTSTTTTKFARVPTLSSIEPTKSSSAVLHAVQEYQRQHIKPHQPSVKRLASTNLLAMKSRAFAQSISNVVVPVKFVCVATPREMPPPLSRCRIIRFNEHI